MKPELHLSVQYAIEEPRLSRQKIRSWVMKALTAASQDSVYPIEVAEINLRLVDKEEATELNQQYREKDYTPNVLTFEYGAGPDNVVRGDVIICIPVLEQEAQEQKKAFLDHAAHLVIHGTLHTLSYDHIDEEEAEHMELLEKTILASMGIKDPYQA